MNNHSNEKYTKALELLDKTSEHFKHIGNTIKEEILPKISKKKSY